MNEVHRNAGHLGERGAGALEEAVGDRPVEERAHDRDAEAFFVAAIGAEREIDFLSVFGSGTPMPLPAFFERYAELASFAEEIILPYTVEGNK